MRVLGLAWDCKKVCWTALYQLLIPLNSGTSILKLFLQKWENASSNKELESMFDCEEGPAFEQILNLSQWDIHNTVTMENRNLLISMLVFEELVGKREKEIKALREGLKTVQL